MIVVDSSALVAVLTNEVDAARYAELMHDAGRLLISAVNVLETGIVLQSRHGNAAEERLWHFLHVQNDFEIFPFNELQARSGIAAFRRYGKGIDPRARLNMSDCAAYALSKTMRVPLLFKGDDFAATDVVICGR